MDVLGESRFPQSSGRGEGRIPQSFLSIAAGFVLVCGSLYLLTSTASWSPQQGIENGPSRPSSANGAAETETPVDIAWPAHAPDQARTREAAPEAAAHDGDEALAAETPLASQKLVEPIEPSSSSPQAQHATAAFGVAPIPEAGAGEAETIVAESMMVSDASAAPENVPVIRALPETTATESADPETPVAAETTAAATDQIGQLIAESPPRMIPTRTIREDTADVPDLPVSASAAPSESIGSAGTAASPETTIAVAPRSSKPKPKREPLAARKTAGSARPSRPEARKQNQARAAAAQQVPAQPRTGLGRELPMALAPANKPVAAPAAKPRPSGAAYSRKVWAALARHKPRAGQKGSPTVVFTIGAGGRLGSARISRSSGNTRIDQLALATIRRAAPFPAPPSGGTSFSIRIDFH